MTRARILCSMVLAAGTKSPELSGAVLAHAKTINNSGGIKDASGKTHKLVVVVCTTKLDPNQAETCARDAVAKDVVAVIGDNSTEGAQIFPILEPAGIPAIGNVVFSPVDATSKVAFPITSGIAGILEDARATVR